MQDQRAFAAQGELKIEFCQPIPEHARLVMEWRNDPETLRMSYHHEPKLWETFWPEFRGSYFKHRDLPPLFATLASSPFAFIRFLPCQAPDGFDRAVDISLNIAPAFRGQGLASPAIQLSLKDLILRSKRDVVVAEVRKENGASHKSFLSAGFVRLGDAVHSVVDTGEVCEITRYLFDLSRLNHDQGSAIV